MNKSKGKTAAKCSSVRIKLESKKAAKAILEKANKKNFGRTVKFDELFELAIGLVTDEHIERLRSRSMTNEDRKELLRQKYIAARGPISKDEFTGFMMTAEFQDFLKEQNSKAIFDNLPQEAASLAG